MPGYLVGQLLGLPSYREKTTSLVVSAQDTLYKAIVTLLTVTAIIWMSIFFYATFYYSYMPAISHARPVHLQFSRSCEKRNHEGMCTFPTANVTLTKRQQLLMVGQPYRILLELEMPESPSNQNLGMFMVCLDLSDKEGVNIDHSCRSAMLHYKSYLHHAIYTLFYSPFLLSGSSEEKQVVQVELFTSFEEDPNRPITQAVIQIQSNHVEIYKTSLQIHAHFTGLRYVMFHWPLLSAVIGITTNLFFLSIIAFLSWFKFFSPKQVTFPVGYDSNQARSLEERRALAKQRLMKERGKLLNQRVVSPSEIPSHLATNKDDLDSVSPDQLAVQSKLSSAYQASTKVLSEQNTNESDSDSIPLKDKPVKESDRRSEDEFVVVPDDISTQQIGTELESETSSQDQDFEKEHKDKKLVDTDEDDKENNPKVVDSCETESDSQQSTLRRRGSLSRH